MKVFFPSILSEKLRKKLNQRGISTVEIPLIKTRPLNFDTEINFSKFDYIVFSSKNGIKHFFSKISPSKIEKCKVVAVGKSTAEKLKEIGIDSKTPEKFSGEGLISLFSDIEIQDKRFLIIRPKVARKVFKEFLQEKGAVVEELIVYETIFNEEEKDNLLKAVNGEIEIFTFTSPSTFKSFLKLSGKTGETVLKKGKIVPIGDVTGKVIIKSGYEIWKMPREFTLNGIVNTILENIENLEER